MSLCDAHCVENTVRQEFTVFCTKQEKPIPVIFTLSGCTESLNLCIKVTYSPYSIGAIVHVKDSLRAIIRLVLRHISATVRWIICRHDNKL